MTIIPVILSGGAGTRLWPLSAGDHPKQFLSLISEKTMIQETLLRLSGLETSEPIVVCGEAHRFIVAQQLSEINAKPKIILEPLARNTAPAIACAARCAMDEDKDAVIVVLPSDHVIRDKAVFGKALMTACNEAYVNSSLVTFGIVPTFPATGYGYVKAGKQNKEVFDLERFVEKPDLATAEKYLASGEFAWNSGMFVFKAAKFLEELEKFEPEMKKLSVQAYEKGSKETDFIRLDKASYEQIKGNSIDYAVMEHTESGKIVKLNAGWDDVGSWSALYDIKEKDENKNVSTGKVIAINTKSSYIRSDKRIVAAIGLEDVVIVDSDEAILVAKMSQVQDVKKAFEESKKFSK